MLTTTENLFREWRAATAYRKRFLDRYDKLMSKVVGPCFETDRLQRDAVRDSSLENVEYEFLALMGPKLAFDNPRTRVSTISPGVQGEIAAGLQHALNRLIIQQEFQQEATPVAFEMLCSHAMSMITFEEQGGRGVMEGVGGEGREGVPMVPRWQHLSLRDGFWDPRATTWRKRIYAGHSFTYDRDIALRLAEEQPLMGWNVEMIKAIGKGTQSEELGREFLNQGDVDRDTVTFVQFHLINDRMDGFSTNNGFNGVIHTIALGSGASGKMNTPSFNAGTTKDSDRPCPPRPFYGPKDGPYDLFGVYPVSDETMPLAPLPAVAYQLQELNDHVKAASIRAEQQKTLVLVDAENAQLAQDIKQNPDMFVVPVKGLDKEKVIPITLGGLQAPDVAYIDMSRMRAHNGLGMGEAQRGQPTGRATALENDIANSASETRFGFMNRQFTLNVQSGLRKMAWYLYHSNSVVLPLGADFAQQMGMQPQVVMTAQGPRIVPADPWFHGGTFEDGSGYTFDDLELLIEPYSMQRTSEAVQMARMQQFIELATVVAPLMPLNPHVKWKNLMRLVADTSNVQEFGDLIDMQVLGQLTGIALQPDQGERPRLSFTAGLGGSNAKTNTASKSDGAGAGSAGRARGGPPSFSFGSSNQAASPATPKPAAGKPAKAGAK
jgi:hypothetical protein